MSELRRGCFGALATQLIWWIPSAHLPTGSNFPTANTYLMVFGFIFTVAMFGKRAA